jgi:glycerophosphoryl diester phosphodiesterase
VEIKCDQAEERVVAAIKEAGRTHNVIVKSFNHRVVKKVKELGPAIRTACLFVGIPIHGYKILADAKADILSVNAYNIDRLLVDECHEHGHQVFVWTVNEPELFRSFADMGVEYIATDYPATIGK